MHVKRKIIGACQAGHGTEINVLYSRVDKKGRIHSSVFLFPSPFAGAIEGSVLRRLILFFFSMVAYGKQKTLNYQQKNLFFPVRNSEISLVNLSK